MSPIQLFPGVKAREYPTRAQSTLTNPSEIKLIIMVFSALYLSALIFAGARLAQGFGRRKRLSASLSSAVGGLFVWFGAKLATASLN